MYKNRNGSRNNIVGISIRRTRLSRDPFLSQRALAEMLQLHGVDLDKNAIQRIESGDRFVTDIEVIAFSEVLDISIDELYSKAAPE